jgi:antitoxin ParD1/3/4
MPTRNVVLTDHNEKIIEDLVKSGRYQNASEVLRDGLRLVERRDAHEKAKLKALQEAAHIGFTALNSEAYIDVRDEYLEQFIADLGRNAASIIANAEK